MTTPFKLLKGVSVFRFTVEETEGELPADQAAFEALLEPLRAHPCPPNMEAVRGWTSVPTGAEHPVLAHGCMGLYAILYRQEKRKVPPQTIHDALEAKVKEVEAREGRELKAKERRELKPVVHAELLPKAFVQSKETLVVLDVQAGLLVIGTPVQGQAMDIINLLRTALPQLRQTPWSARFDVSGAMTQWLSDEPPEAIELTGSFTLCEAEKKSNKVSFSGLDLDDEEFMPHLADGRYVTQMGLVHDGRLSCVLGEDGTLRKVSLTDAKAESLQHDEERGELEGVALFDADLLLLECEIAGLVKALEHVLGDEAMV